MEGKKCAKGYDGAISSENPMFGEEGEKVAALRAD